MSAYIGIGLRLGYWIGRMEVLLNLLTERYNIKKREVILKLAMKRAMNNSVHLLSIFKLIGFVLYSVFMVVTGCFAGFGF